ncbi:MAG: methylenetetrahydrofolate reductase (NADPH) [Gammaproteobacteria bacterium]|jgi:methylenetetrahydrofolate reductase (NADPH)
MKSNPVQISYEFFPPRNPNMVRRLWRTVGQLERFNPSFFSMTYGALGSAKQVSVDTAIELHGESSVPVAAHLTCGEASAEEVNQVAQQYYAKGIRSIVALRGDSSAVPPKDKKGKSYQSVIELIQGLKEIGDFDISVGAYPEVHPQATSAKQDLEHLKQKLDAGASRAITQYFFGTDEFLRFRDKASQVGIDKPIVPGILPIHDLDKVRNFSQRCGANFPEQYQALFDKVKNDPAGQYSLSMELAVQQCERLRDAGVSEFHFYTLNQTDLCLDVSLALGVSVSPLSIEDAA